MFLHFWSVTSKGKSTGNFPGAPGKYHPLWGREDSRREVQAYFCTQLYEDVMPGAVAAILEP